MSQWLISPNENFIHKFIIRYQENDGQLKTYHHICHLELHNTNIVVKDLLRRQIKQYDMNYEVSSSFTPLKFEEINPIINSILEFLNKCSNKSLFEDYFSEDPNNINERNIKILSLLNIDNFDYIQNPSSIETIILEKLKNIWIEKIKETKEDVLKYIDSEIYKLKGDLAQDNLKILEAYLETRQLADTYDYMSELNNIKSVDDLIQYWPVIFLPAPAFINDLYHSTR